ncbi:MAG: alpha/beta fold hydrolase, partial [Chloroflexi bacterium]|nr:alpha/beta fold hydrolase [Chloroflexota bacterium]
MIQHEVSFQSGGGRMAGTLAVPDGPGPYPAVLLIPGSGQVDRDENHKKMRMNAFALLALHLAGQGFATLRYDKRGVGASEGDFWTTGFHDNVADATAALGFLKGEERVKAGSVFLMGHSEGALIATRMAAEGADVAGAVLLAGPAQQGEAVLKWQAAQIVPTLGGFTKFIVKLFRIDPLKQQQNHINKVKRSTKDTYRIQLVAKINAKWLREFLAYDPAEDFPRITVPVLAVTGSKDLQVPPDDLTRMAELATCDFESYLAEDV